MSEPAPARPSQTATPAAGPAATDPAIPLPRGFGVAMDAGTRELSDGSLFGGSPARVLRMTSTGNLALAQLREGPVRSAAAAVLARRLTDAGLAHPVPPGRAANSDRTRLEVTVVIPVRDRPVMLERCLAATSRTWPVVVVDDGSADPGAIAAVTARHGASLRRRDTAGGPAAARNTGLAGIESDLVAFLDSDCVPPACWIDQLAPHFADPLVAAVAPRVVAPAIQTSAGRYEQVRGSLDFGARPARVWPGSRVGYVPTAALLVRRAALDEACSGGTFFDPSLRYGEDVDLIWRLHAAGWRIRYEPAVQVRHDGPADWPALLGRRFWYGTSAAPLARRHPANLAPLVLQPWPAGTVAALLARRPAMAAACVGAAWLELTAILRRAGVPADGALRATLTAVRQTWLGAGRYATQFAGPALAAALAVPGGKTPARRWGRRAAAASLLLGPPLAAYAERRPDLDPVRFTFGHIADDACYGAGVLAGCLRQRTTVPIRPVISWRSLRITAAGQAKGPD